LHAGDAITGTSFYSFYGPAPDAAVMNTAGYDALVAGNHEFDDGDANLANFTRLLNNPVLSYNRKSYHQMSAHCQIWHLYRKSQLIVLLKCYSQSRAGFGTQQPWRRLNPAIPDQDLVERRTPWHLRHYHKDIYGRVVLS
jgi:hypothetical protein